MAIDTHGIYIAPILKKGQLVRVRQGVQGSRACTAADASLSDRRCPLLVRLCGRSALSAAAVQ